MELKFVSKNVKKIQIASFGSMTFFPRIANFWAKEFMQLVQVDNVFGHLEFVHRVRFGLIKKMITFLNMINIDSLSCTFAATLKVLLL